LDSTTLIPLFLVNEKGVSIEVANTDFWTYPNGGLVVTFLAGFLIDRIGVKRVLLLSLLARASRLPAWPLRRTFPLLVTCWFCRRLSWPSFSPPALVTISKLTTFQRSKRFCRSCCCLRRCLRHRDYAHPSRHGGGCLEFSGGMMVQGLLTMGICFLG